MFSARIRPSTSPSLPSSSHPAHTSVSLYGRREIFWMYRAIGLSWMLQILSSVKVRVALDRQSANPRFHPPPGAPAPAHRSRGAERDGTVGSAALRSPRARED